MSDQARAYVFALLAVGCWSTVATAFKLSLEYLSPAQLLLCATFFSCFALATVISWQGQWRYFRGVGFKELRASMLFGVINPFLYYLVLFGAYERLPAQQAQAINYSWALMLTMMSVVFLKQSMRGLDYLAAIICYTGVLVIATQGGFFEGQQTDLLGVGLALLSTVLWSAYWILSTRDQRPPVAGLLLNFMCALPLILLYCTLTGELQPMDWRGVLGASYIGVFEMGWAFVFWLAAMKLTSSTAKIAHLIYLSPFISLVFIALVLSEPIAMSTLIGLCFIVAGLLLTRYKAQNR